MFSQEDLDTYNRVQSAMEAQQQVERQNRRRGRLARILAWVFIPLFLAASGVAGYLAYDRYLLLSVVSDWQAASQVQGVRVENLGSRLAVTEANLTEANGNVKALNRSLATEREERNADVVKANATIRRLEEDVVKQNTEIESAGKRLKESNDRIAHYVEVNTELETSAAQLEESVAQLDASNRQLESANNSLTRRNRELDQENDQLVADFNGLVGDYNSLLDENDRLAGRVNSLNSRVSTLQSQLTQARAQQVTIPTCASNYYTVTGGKLSCVARSSSAFRATQTDTGTVRLPHSGTVNLKINRSGELGSDRSMEILEHAVKTIEEYMGEPIPLQGNEIRLDFVEELDKCSSQAAGCHLGTHMEIKEMYDSSASLRGDDHLALIIAHEVAHYYWNDEKTWMSEGGAEFLSIYSENKRVGRAMTSKGKRCSQASNIRYLESRKFGKEDNGFECNYTLGEGLFLDLYNNLTEGQFQQGFRNLWKRGKNKMGGMYQVRQAFTANQQIIDKWYGYREKPELHWNDGTFLGYMTWEESDGWKLYYDDESPCATTLRLNDQSAGVGYSVRQTEEECHYTGEWDDNGDLIVTIDGKEYRAVEVEISSPPNRYDL